MKKLAALVGTPGVDSVGHCFLSSLVGSPGSRSVMGPGQTRVGFQAV